MREEMENIKRSVSANNNFKENNIWTKQIEQENLK